MNSLNNWILILKQEPKLRLIEVLLKMNILIRQLILTIWARWMWTLMLREKIKFNVEKLNLQYSQEKIILIVIYKLIILKKLKT